MNFANLVHWSLQHRAAVIGAALLLLIAGIWQGRDISVDVLPDLTRPTVSIHMESPALSASDAATQLAWPVENALIGLPDLARLRSSSVAGLALVQAEFAWGTDPFRNRQLVTERLDATRALLPAGTEPRLGPLTSLMGEVLLIALSGTESTDLRALRTHADWSLRPALLATPGVSQVTVIGGEIAQWEVRPDPALLKLFDVRIEKLVSALSGYGENRGGGIEPLDGREHSLRGIGVPFDAAELENVAVDHREAGPVWLRQVASVAEGARLRRGAAGVDGSPAVILAVQKQLGVDTLAVTAAVEARLANLDAQLPKGAKRTTVFRQADFIRASVTHVRDALLHGALIVALVLAFFLSGGRANLISLIAIPISVAGAIVVLSWLDLSINTLTLGGLAIAVGELVDDAVVGVENVARRLREAGTATADIVASATVEVRAGILQATLIVVAGFLPLFALGGVEGQLFTSLGAAYVAAILVSLLVAATLTPVLCAMGFLGDASRLPKERVWMQRVKTRYVQMLSSVLARARLLFAGCMALLMMAAIVLVTLPRSFLPTLNESTLTVNLVLTPGLALDESDRVGRAAERLILGLPEAQSVGRRTGRAELDEHSEGVHYSELDVRLGDSDRSRADIVADLQQRLAVLPGSVSVSQPISHRIDHLLSGVRAPVAVKIFGEDSAKLQAIAAQVRAELAQIPGLSEARLDAEGQTFETGIRVDAARAALYGLSPPQVLDTVTSLTAGRVLSRIVEAPRRIDLVLRLPEDARDPGRLGDLLIDSPAGPVPLHWIASVESMKVPDRVLREDGRRRLLVSAFSSGDIGAATLELQQRVARILVPTGYEIRIEGQATEAQQASRRLLGLAAIALLLMAAVLYARFGSITLALIVMGSIPLAWVGGVFALALSGTPLSVASLIGFITLAGIAARNSILKIGRYIDMSENGSQVIDAALILKGSAERLTPVLMTSLVAALSLLPLLIGAETPGKEILHPVALVVFGGLIGSTLLDSFVTPALFQQVTRVSQRVA